jgi:hypothetical protein
MQCKLPTWTGTTCCVGGPYTKTSGPPAEFGWTSLAVPVSICALMRTATVSLDSATTPPPLIAMFADTGSSVPGYKAQLDYQQRTLQSMVHDASSTSCNIDNLLDRTVTILNANEWLGRLANPELNVAAETVSDLADEINRAPSHYRCKEAVAKDEAEKDLPGQQARQKGSVPSD